MYGYIPSELTALIMLFITMVCWGSWANALKKCGNWRFESFYIDYSLGIVIFTFLLGIILGGFGQTEGWSATSFIGGLADSSLSGIMLAVFAGFVWGLGNILLVVAVTLAGFAIAFPLSLGIALVLGTSLAYLTNPGATNKPSLLFAGLILATMAVIANGLAYKLKEKHHDSPNSLLKKGILISVACGLLISLFPFPFNFAFEKGISGYSGAFFMTIGGLMAATILLPILMKNTVKPDDKKIGLEEYKRAKPSWHLWALGAALVWSVGTVFNLVVASMPNFSVAIAYTIGQCAPMVAAIWGIFVWKEFDGAPKSAKYLLGVMFALFIASIVFLSQANG